jgi:hypothetical protein
MALSSAGDHSVDAAALTYLQSQQLADGGFIYSSMYGGSADPYSDALVLQTLVATGQDPEGASWLQGASSVLTHLRSIQAAGGGFAYPGMGPDAFTTSQVPAALVRVPYAAAAHWASGRSLPAIECPGSSPSANSTATSKPTAKPTARRTAHPTARPTVRPTALPTANPTDATEPADSAAPTQAPTAEPVQADSAAPSPTFEVAGVTFVPGDSIPGPSDSSAPPALLYGAAALLGLVIVLGCGWLYLARPWTR